AQKRLPDEVKLGVDQVLAKWWINEDVIYRTAPQRERGGSPGADISAVRFSSVPKSFCCSTCTVGKILKDGLLDKKRREIQVARGVTFGDATTSVKKILHMYTTHFCEPVHYACNHKSTTEA